ncbi:hypothetical protein HYG93_18465 [Acinetobacter sp. SwsAc6]|jgi:RHS repeat-associated protein|uniref:RHS repeat-associated core domain-containing protein n=1 Tax=Acinetobacter sp. SwsAc6 TaxID=2749439 RepID=UPI0015B7C74D|nr:RHS repeat-associated core domain-containing protein [Acinetobacter sp. SwsAc6]NWK76193.1 hypothetical protein [Acinetobacter sp. SwsAc6]
MKKILSIFYIYVLFCSIASANYQFTENIAQNIINQPQVESCLPGIDIRSDEFTYNLNHADGPLPYSQNYSTALGENFLLQDFVTNGAISTGGWRDNYANSVIVNDMGGSNTNRIRFIVMLPGENTKNVYAGDVVNNSIQNIKRLNSQDPYMYYAVDRDGRSEIRNAFGTIGELNINHGDMHLEITTNNYNITNTKSINNVEGIKFEIYKNGNLYFFENINRDGINLQDAVYKVTYIKYASGKEIELSYSNLSGALKRIVDHRGNFIVFDDFIIDQDTYEVAYEYPKTVYIGTSSNPDSFGINSYISPSDLFSSQIIKYNYDKIEWVNFFNNRKEYIYVISNSTSKKNGTENYQYEYVNPITFQVTEGGRFTGKWNPQYAIPSLSRVNGSWNKVKHIITYKADLSPNWYHKLQSVSGPAGLMNATRKLEGGNVDDNKKTFEKRYSINIPNYNSMNYKIYGNTKSRLINMDFSGFPCITYNEVPVSYILFDIIDNKILKIIDYNKNETTFEYDSKKRVTLITEAPGSPIQRQTKYTYSDSIFGYKIPLTIESALKTIKNELYEGKVISSEESFFLSNKIKRTKYRYNKELITSVNYPNGNNVDISYTKNGLISLFNISKGIDLKSISFSNYTNTGKPGVVIEDGVRVQYSYNENDDLTSQIETAGGLTRTKRFYYTNKYLTSELDFDQVLTSYTYDSAGLISKEETGSVIKQFSYDNNLNLVSIDKTDGTTKRDYTAVYNANGQLQEERDGANPDKLWTKFTYDNNENEISQSSPGFNIVSTSLKNYDVLNRVSSYTDTSGGIHLYKYDSLDNIIEQTAPTLFSIIKKFQNDNEFDEDKSEDFGIKKYTYMQDSKLDSYVHNDYKKCVFGNYNLNGQIKSFNCSDTYNTSTDYNVNYILNYKRDTKNLINVISKNNSNLEEYKFWGANTDYLYDSFNRIITKNQILGLLQNSGSSNKLSVGYGYTPEDKISKITYPSGKTIEYKYNQSNIGELSKVTYNGSDLLSFSIKHDQVEKITWGNGNTSIFTYDDSNLLTSINNNIGSTVNKNIDISYYNNGATKSKKYSGKTIDFTYDLKGQLTEEKMTEGQIVQYIHNFQYDGNGNRISFQKVGIASPYNFSNAIYGYSSGSNRYSSIKFDSKTINFNYDSTGELQLPDLIGKANYDFYGRRFYQFANTSNTTSPHVDQYNHKNEKVFSGLGRQFIYDESGHLLGEYNINGNPYVEYVWVEDVPVVALFPDKVVYIISDNTSPVLGIDSSNNTVVWEWFRDAFGVSKPSVETNKINLRFPGQYYESNTGLHYNINRNYNPSLGRYMEPDPINMEGGWNTYIYAANDPINLSDSTGLNPVMLVRLGTISYEIYAVSNGEPPGLKPANLSKLATNEQVLTTSIREAAKTPELYATKAATKGKKSSGRAGRQKVLRALKDDPKAPSHVRGWIKQELNRIRNNPTKSIRNPRGMQLAHFRGYEAQKGYSYAYSHLNLTSLHKLQHKYDRNGILNKEAVTRR